jgi:4,5-dihydroxyphthalate decarboxylase
MLLAKGASPYVAIPVFLSRSFRHSAIYVPAGSDIRTPQDLRGRKVGVPEYQLTAPVWVRGILQDEYGVHPRELRWRTGGVETPGRHEKISLSLPADIELEPIAAGRTLNEMLLTGEIDALIAPRAPSAFHLPGRPVRRLFEDFRTVEQAYFAKTGLFPIMHVVGVRRSLVEAHPWLAASLLKAFTRAKDLALAELAEVAALKVSLPWVAAEQEATAAAMGRDFWSYGQTANEQVLETFLRYHHEQGLSPRRVQLDEMFAPGTREQFII